MLNHVGKLKEQPGRDILKFGTGELDRLLLRHNLVDEFHFWVFPTLAGDGDRLLDGIDTTHLRLIGTKPFSTGIVVLTYAPK